MQRKQADCRIAIFGAGLVGRKHAELVSQHALLDAIIDPASATADQAAALGVKHFTGVEDYLTNNTPDGIIIATPNQLHVTQALACVEKGIPVLVEKPIADDVDEAQVLVETAKRKNVPILVGHHRRHNPLIKRAKQIIKEGHLGQLVSVHATFWLYKPDDYFKMEWRRQKGAGPTYINLIHDIDLLRHLCGEVEHVQAMEANNVRGFEVEDTAAVMMRFANGALGTVNVSDTIPAPWSWELTAGENPAYPKQSAFSYMIGGTKGALSVPDLTLHTYEGKAGWWEELKQTSHTAEQADPLVEQIYHFVDVIAGHASPLVSGEEGLRTLEVVKAIKKSAQQSQNKC